MINLAHPRRSVFFDLRRWAIVLALTTLAALAGLLIAAVPSMAFILVGMIGVVGYALLAVARPFVAFVVLIFLALSAWLSVIEVAPGISIMVGVGLIFTTIWLSQLVIHAAVFIKVREYGWILGLVGVVVASSLANPYRPAGFAPVFTYFQLFLLFVLMVNLTTTGIRLHIFSIVIVASSVLLALMILLNQFDLLPLGHLFEQSSKVWLDESGAGIRASRARGLWGGPNMTAVQLTVALPFLIEWWPATRYWRDRALLIAAVVALLGALVFTLSVGGMIGLFAILLTKEIIEARRGTLSKLLRLTYVAALALLLFPTFVPDLYVQRIALQFDMLLNALRTQDEHLLLRLATDRGDTWWATLNTIVSAPWLGHGPGNTAYINARYTILYSGVTMRAAHNSLLSVSGDLGLIGLVCFVGLLVSAIAITGRAWRAPIGDPAVQRLGKALFVALISYMVQGLALDIHMLKLFWVLLALAIAYGRVACSATTISELKTRGQCR